MQEMMQRKIQDHVIINPTKETLTYLRSRESNKYREQYQHTKVLPEQVLHISGDTTIYNNTFAVAYWKQGEVVGVEIENPELVKTQKSIFHILWKQAKSI